MKKVFSAWLLDIAKYVVTALILSSALKDSIYSISQWYYYMGCFVFVAVVVSLGVFLFKRAEKEEKEKNV